MGQMHRDLSATGLHEPWYESFADPVVEYGTETDVAEALFGVEAGQVWRRHEDGDYEDTLGVYIRNEANTAWVTLFGVPTVPSVLEGDLLYGDYGGVLATLAAGAEDSVLIVDAGLPAWATTVPLAAIPTIPATKGGTGLTTWTLGDLPYASATDVLSALAGNITTTRKFLRQVGDGGASAAPAWDTLTAADIAAGVFPVAATWSFAGSTILNLGTVSAATSISSSAFVGPLTGNASTATLAATVTVVDSTSATCWVALFDAATGSLAAKTDGGLTYAATTGRLTVTELGIGTSGLTTYDALDVVRSGGGSVVRAMNLRNNAASAIGTGTSFSFFLNGAGGAVEEYGRFGCVATNVTSNAGYIFWSTMNAGLLVETLRLTEVGNLAQNGATKHFFDGMAGTGDTYVTESSANILDLYAGGAKALSLAYVSAGIASVTLVGTAILPAATTSLSPLRIPHGTAHSSPTNGDIWTTTAGVFARINGASYSLDMTAV